MSDFFSTPDDLGDIRQSELQSSLGDRLAAQAAQSLPSLRVFQTLREAAAGGEDIGLGANPEGDLVVPEAAAARQAEFAARRAAIPDISIDDAKARVKQESLEGHLTLPNQSSIKSPVLDLMIQDAHEQRDRQVAIQQGPQGFLPDALGAITSIGAGMIDPLNIAAFSIPVVGEARWGKIIASAGDSMLARAGLNAGRGAVQGAVGTAALQPLDWWYATRDGQDYTMADALKSIALGAGMGAAAHAGFGAIGDIRARARGAPLPGSPEDLLQRGLMTGRHIPADVLGEEGVSADDLAAAIEAPTRTIPGEPPPDLGRTVVDINGERTVIDTDLAAVRAAAMGGAAPVHPAEMLADLPPAVREDVLRSAIADMIDDRPVRADQVLSIAADHDPRIAESFEAYHGSPHDFDPEQEKHVIMGALETEFEKAGEDVSAIDPKLLARTVEIVHREGVSDVLDAYERAIMEDEERYNAIADARRSNPAVADIPGFDDAGAAPGDGGRDRGLGGQAGRSDQGGSGPNDSQPSSHGARAAAAATDPRWRELADVRPSYDDPQAIAESRAADEVPEPGSLVPETALTAAEKAAADAEEIWRQVEPNLTEEERNTVNEALKQLNQDKTARAQIIADGAACLAAAYAA